MRARVEHQRTGFTLVELIAVVAIVAIMAAVAAPAVSSISQTRRSLAGRQLLADLTYARQRAVATGTRTWVEVDASAETWSILVEPAGNPGRGSATVLPDPAGVGDFTVTLGEPPFVDVAIQSADFDGAEVVGFDWLGRPLAANELPLVATGSVALAGGATVSVERGTGYASFTGE